MQLFLTFLIILIALGIMPGSKTNRPMADHGTKLGTITDLAPVPKCPPVCPEGGD